MGCSVNECGKKYHVQCTNMSSALQSSGTWICPECRLTSKSKVDSILPRVIPSKDRRDANVTLRKKPQTQIDYPEPYTDADLGSELRSLRCEVSLLRDQLSHAISLIASYETKLDRYSVQVSALNDRFLHGESIICHSQPQIASMGTQSTQSTKPKKVIKKQKAAAAPQRQSVDQVPSEHTRLNALPPGPSCPVSSEQQQWTEVKRSRRPPSLCGTAGPNITLLKAVEPRKYIHLWNMESSADEIREYLRQLCPGGSCTVTELSPRGDYKSYKLGVPVAYFDTCLSIDVWPINARIKTWVVHSRKQLDPSASKVNQPFRGKSASSQVQ